MLFLANVSERKFFNLSYTICMKIYETIQHSMDIYDEIFILWHSIFLNLSIHWHLEFRFSIELFLMCHYYITRSFARSLTFFIPISHVRYIYDHSNFPRFRSSRKIARTSQSPTRETCKKSLQKSKQVVVNRAWVMEVGTRADQRLLSPYQPDLYLTQVFVARRVPTTPDQTISGCVMWCTVMQCEAMWCNVVQCDAMWCDVI